MPNRDGSPTRAERAMVRQAEFHHRRINDAASLAETLNAGFCYLTAVIKRMAATDPKKAEKVTADVIEYLLRQANTHAMHASKGVKR